MIKFCSLRSGSCGNSIFISNKKDKILVDAGLPGKTIDQALKEIGENPLDIKAILLTHEHLDHIKGVGIYSRKYDIPIYANENTWSKFKGKIGKVKEENIKYFENGKYFSIGNLDIKAFKINHDAIDPVGFSVFSKNKKITIATDTGIVDKDMVENLKESDILLLESNHDVDMVKMSSYPFYLKERILGNKGHLSNDTCGKVIAYLTERGMKTFILGHLSKENNFPELVYETVKSILDEKNIRIGKDIELSIATRHNASSVIKM